MYSDCAKPTKNQEQSETKKYNSAFAVNNGISKPILVNPATKATDLKISFFDFKKTSKDILME